MSILAATGPVSGDASGTIGGLVFFMALALGVSFLCSLLEAGILSAPTSYIETQAQTGSRAGRLMQKHKENVEEPITAILTLNTVAHTVGAAGAGAQAAGVFGNEWFGVISAVLTLLILTLSEIIPKTLGAVYWKQLYAFTALSVQALVIALYPAVWGFRALTRLITPEEALPTITRSELEMMAHIGGQEGALAQDETLILKNLLRLDKVQVVDIMTPRTVMLALTQDMTVGEVVGGALTLSYSRIPIYGENIDDIVGFVLRHDVLERAAQDEMSVRLNDLAREIYPVPETVSVKQVLSDFMTRQQHIFLVIDEYGGTSGIITLEDAVESLLGVEITDESDIVADLRQLAQQRYKRQKLLRDTAETSAATPHANGRASDTDLSAQIASTGDQSEPID
jgi:CBS domain containing-hemolysin-like protein